jgi:hypothetical protein
MMKRVVYPVAMIFGIAVAGVILGILSAIILAALLKDGYEGWGGLIGIVMGMSIGYPVGVFIGLVIFKKFLHYNGSLLFGLIGVIIGGVLPFLLAEPLSLNLNTTLLWTFMILCSPVLGTAGFYLGKKR